VRGEVMEEEDDGDSQKVIMDCLLHSIFVHFI